MKPTKYEIRIGVTYNSWTVIEKLPNQIRQRANNKTIRQTRYLCQCKCGRRSEVTGAALWCNASLGCRNCKQMPRKPNGEAAWNRVYGRYKNDAVRRHLEFSLSIEEFKRICTKDCTYCGFPPSNIGGARETTGLVEYNGIDRVDNVVGYIPGNMVTCCFQCNKSKGTLTVEEFETWIQRLITFRPKK